jgi:hypothetical protein
VVLVDSPGPDGLDQLVISEQLIMRHGPVHRSAEVMVPWWPGRAIAGAMHQAIGPERRA